jgi:hypothetical protein
MELVTAGGGRRKAASSRDSVSQLRDIGDRLEHVLGRYGRLVRDVTDGPVPVPDLSGRVALITSQLGFVAERLQELIVIEHQAGRAERLAAGRIAPDRRHVFPRRMVRAMA